MRRGSYVNTDHFFLGTQEGEKTEQEGQGGQVNGESSGGGQSLCIGGRIKEGEREEAPKRGGG